MNEEFFFAEPDFTEQELDLITEMAIEASLLEGL